ncbi:hypothetical protein HMPREF9538_02079 [Klebsiella sp. MS 92-3]|nr:hypothetical protein HMPREF9538_02079 [Klebsiella sp. MS 92-3]
MIQINFCYRSQCLELFAHQFSLFAQKFISAPLAVAEAAG